MVATTSLSSEPCLPSRGRAHLLTPFAASPVCRSPLSQQAFRPDSPAPIHIAAAPDARRQSITLSPRRLSTSRSLAGSYTLSLLSARMSAAHPTHHVPSAFTLKIGSVSPARHVPSALKCPPHVKISFDARWHSLDGAGPSSAVPAAAWTPWVGNVDVEGWYRYQRRIKTLEWAREQCTSAVHDAEDEDATPDLAAYYERILKGWIPSLEDISHAPPSDRALLHKMRTPSAPGYQLGVCGKIQLFIMQTVDQPTTNTSTAGTEQTTPVKVFLVDYDLASLVPGGRLLYKERAYQTIDEDRIGLGSPSTTAASPGAKQKAREVLKYAFELHFLCTEKPRSKTHGKHSTHTPAAPEPEAARKRRLDTTMSATHKHRSYYLGKQIRLVFPTSSGSLNNTDGATTAAPRPPSIRVERLIEVQNPVTPTAMQPEETDDSARLERPLTKAHHGSVKLSESFTSESWDGLRARSWAVQDTRRRSTAAETGGNDGESGQDNPMMEDRRLEQGGQGYRPTTIPDREVAPGILFTRSPTPVPPVSLKSPSLLTARLEEMSSLSSQVGPPSSLAVSSIGNDSEGIGDDFSAGQGQRVASPSGGKRRMLWPDDDSERLLSESLKKVSYR